MEVHEKSVQLDDGEYVEAKFSVLDILRMLAGILLLYCCVCRFFTGGWSLLPFKNSSFTEPYHSLEIPAYWVERYTQHPISFSIEELSKYGGQDDSPRILLSIKGFVFDVTRGSRFYGKWGPYNKFTGADCTRLFSYPMWDLTAIKKDCSYDLHNLTFTELERIDTWLQFFRNKYPEIGYIEQLF